MILKPSFFFFLIVASSFQKTAQALIRCNSALLKGESPQTATQTLKSLKAQRDLVRAQIKDIKCIYCIRSFAPRADLMNFLEGKFGLDWLKQGKAILDKMLESKVGRFKLSPEEKLLADGTAYFLAIELNLNKKDIQLDENRREKIVKSLEIASIEAKIEEQLRLGAADSRPLYQRQFTDDYVINLKHNLQLTDKSLHIAKNDKDEVEALFLRLNNEGIYLATVDIDVRTLPTQAKYVWKRLGYESVPYQVTYP